jgi:hypothetical protein
MLGGEVIDSSSTASRLSSLWATSAFHLNDSREFTHGKEILSAALSALPRDALQKTMVGAIRRSDGLDVYCCCFTAVDDDLSQWRGYGDNGRGVCLEFDLAELTGGIYGLGYWVIYGSRDDDGDKVAVARELVYYLHATIMGMLPDGAKGIVVDEVREQLTEIWPTLALAFKHFAFSAEREFRIVYSEAIGPTIPRSFRSGPLVPFVKLGMLDGKLLPLKSIRLGPAVSSDLDVRSLEFALGKLGLGAITVKRSDIPYVPR